MNRKYIIDGNNLIGKIPQLHSIPKSSRQSARERLAVILDRYFTGKKVKASLHLDGFAGPAIKTSHLQIHYSNSKTADEFIRHEIESAKNPKLITLVSSDRSLAGFAKACSCSVIKAEIFALELFKQETHDEAERIKTISIDEIRDLFGA
jgi:predicted RNA-binding protein with PIN domain